MKNNKQIINFVVLIGVLILSVNSSYAQNKYRIISIYPSSSKVKINNVPRGVDYVFSKGDVIRWEKGQEITAKNTSTNRLCMFSEESFSARNAKTVEQYLTHNQLSSRGEWPVNIGVRNAESFPEKRLALVIGIANYSYLQPLRNSLNDANEVSNKLQSLGFDVMNGFDLQSGDHGVGDEFHDIVRSFYKRAAAYDVALFYYAGHGLKYEKDDYLLPRDLSLENDGSYGLNKKGLSVLEIVRMGYDSGVKKNIIVLDACRNESANWVRGNEIETGQIEPPENCCIFYSTRSGKTAEDWSSTKDKNSPFAKSFISNIGVPGNNIATVFDNIRTGVYNSTSSKQHPVYINQLSEDFYFYRGATSGGILSIASVPPGASVYLDNKEYKGKTELTITGLSPGAHTIELKMDGYDDFHTSAHVSEGVTSMISITLGKKTSAEKGTAINENGVPNTKESIPRRKEASSAIKYCLAAYYSFDEQNTKDSGAGGFDGYASGDVKYVTDTPSGIGYAAYLNGLKKGCINIPYNVFAGKTSYSISLWLKDFDYGVIISAISSYDASSDFPRLLANMDDTFRFFTRYDNCGNTPKFVYDTSKIKFSGWHHIVIVCEHSGPSYDNNATKRLYVDGKLMDLQLERVDRYFNVHGFDEDIIRKMVIGGDRKGAYDHCTTMTVDEVRFYTTALSKETVQELYQFR